MCEKFGCVCPYFRNNSVRIWGSVAGAVLRWARGAQPPPNVGQAPQIFWFQQQKYVFLKFRLFLYSGEINTRIS